MHTLMFVGALQLEGPKPVPVEVRGERNSVDSSLLPLTKPLLSQGPWEGGVLTNPVRTL